MQKSDRGKSKKSNKNLSEKGRQVNIKSKKINKKSKSNKNKAVDETTKPNKKIDAKCNELHGKSSQEQLSFFLDQYQSANGVKLSSLEVESINDTCIIQLPETKSDTALVEVIKGAFGSSYKQVLCEKQISNTQPGSPAVIVISLSALRSLELLRQLRPLTRECPPAKLFSKHMKVEEQVSFLKNRVNIASGTPNRIKKLIDVEALGLSRLSVVILDMYTDVKGYSLITLPQVRDELWDLYKSCFHQRLLQNDIRVCLYTTPTATI